MSEKISRRDFLRKSAVDLAGLTVVPSAVLGKAAGHTAPSDKLNIAAVGIGGMGAANLQNMETENIVALCDVDWKYAKNTFDRYPNAKRYWDYRKMLDEMGKDIVRLTKVVDRFSKIGAATPLCEGVINEIVGNSVIYFRTRVPKNVTLTYNGLAMAQQKAMINEALFEWVIENLLKNAMDALSGTGTIDVKLSSDANWIYVDVRDSGKGIAKGNFKRIFEPGFTTKTRGWGLGLSLSKRIIEGYHGGRIYVLDSEIDKGTTIRVALKKIYT